jgi:hypothetical protein
LLLLLLLLLAAVTRAVSSSVWKRGQTASKKLEAPEDKTITTLWVGGLDDKTTEADIKYVCGREKCVMIWG